MERTFVMLKPDSIQRRLLGRVISRFEDRGLRILAMKLLSISELQAAALYAEHKGKSFYDRLIAFTTCAPAAVMVLSGKNAIAIVRGMLGDTAGVNAQPGTIRGDFSISATNRNLVHAASTASDAERQIRLFFNDNEIRTVSSSWDDNWLYSDKDLE